MPTTKHTTKEVNVRAGAKSDGRSESKANSRGLSRATGLNPALATPTDLSAEQVQAVTETLNPLIADAFALYIKTKNYHWHLASSHFRDYHLLFDEQAESIFASIDVLAERVRKIGGTTIRSVSQVGELQTIADDNDDFVPPEEMVRRLLEDNKAMAAALRQAAETAEENKDLSTANVLEEILDETERRIWFLYETSQGGDHQR